MRTVLGRADLHVHSTWSDGCDDPEALVRAAAGRVDVLAVTDHDCLTGALLAETFARRHPELGVEVVPGEEISTLNGHLLALFIRERVPPGLNAERTIALVHAQDGLAIAAHPYHPLRYARRGHRPLVELMGDLALDGVEVVNNTGRSRASTTPARSWRTTAGGCRSRAAATRTPPATSAAPSRASRAATQPRCAPRCARGGRTHI